MVRGRWRETVGILGTQREASVAAWLGPDNPTSHPPARGSHWQIVRQWSHKGRCRFRRGFLSLAALVCLVNNYQAQVFHLEMPLVDKRRPGDFRGAREDMLLFGARRSIVF